MSMSIQRWEKELCCKCGNTSQWNTSLFRIPPTLIMGQVRQPEGQMQSLGASQTMLLFYKVDTISYFITASGHRLPKSSSFLTISFLPVSCPSKRGYLASTLAHVMLPLARSRTTLGSSETWGKTKEKSKNQST